MELVPLPQLCSVSTNKASAVRRKVQNQTGVRRDVARPLTEQEGNFIIPFTRPLPSRRHLGKSEGVACVSDLLWLARHRHIYKCIHVHTTLHICTYPFPSNAQHVSLHIKESF